MHLALLVPGPLTTISGGYGYDRAIIAGLRDQGHKVTVTELAGRHPLPDDAARASAHAAWNSLPADAIPVIDGLGLPAFADLADALVARGAVGLIHHPTCMEAGLPPDEAETLRTIETALFARLPRLIVTSDVTAATLSASFGVASDRVGVVVPGTAPATRCTGSGGPGCAILAIGSLIPRKGHDLLLNALARLFDLDWHLTIAGGDLDSLTGHSLKAQVETLQITTRVTFAGPVVDDALDALWARTDLFALATHYEGYGMAIAEALAHGLPVVVTDGGAAGKLITPDAGAVCPVGDVVTLSKTLRRMIFDTQLRGEMAEHAWALGQALPDWPEQARTFARLLAA
jgi:glycosyltransferase involved in cell wall biosynthesis